MLPVRVHVCMCGCVVVCACGMKTRQQNKSKASEGSERQTRLIMFGVVWFVEGKSRCLLSAAVLCCVGLLGPLSFVGCQAAADAFANFSQNMSAFRTSFCGVFPCIQPARKSLQCREPNESWR